MRIYWAKEIGAGIIGMMARPKGGDWLESEIDALVSLKVGLVVSLLELEEILDLGIEREKEFCLSKGIQYINHPIPDRGIPRDQKAFVELISEIGKELRNGVNVVVHCRMGIGRTGLVMAAIVLREKPEVENIFEYLSEIRTLRMPDTSEQIDWIKKNKNVLQHSK